MAIISDATVASNSKKPVKNKGFYEVVHVSECGRVRRRIGSSCQALFRLGNPTFSRSYSGTVEAFWITNNCSGLESLTVLSITALICVSQSHVA